MRNLVAGAIGGLVAGAALSGVMLAGRRAGLLHRTLAEHSEDWLDRNFASRAYIGKTGTSLAEQGTTSPPLPCSAQRTRSWSGALSLPGRSTGRRSTP
jgi:hypothetical protein